VIFGAPVRKIDAYAIALRADLGPRQMTDLVPTLTRQEEKLDNAGVVASHAIGSEPHFTQLIPCQCRSRAPFSARRLMCSKGVASQ
jgi:hypothetical protein